MKLMASNFVNYYPRPVKNIYIFFLYTEIYIFLYIAVCWQERDTASLNFFKRSSQLCSLSDRILRHRVKEGSCSLSTVRGMNSSLLSSLRVDPPLFSFLPPSKLKQTFCCHHSFDWARSFSFFCIWMTLRCFFFIVVSK